MLVRFGISAGAGFGAAIVVAITVAVADLYGGPLSTDGRVAVGPEGRSVYVDGGEAAFTYARDARGRGERVEDESDPGRARCRWRS